ncbi:MAG: catalase, partial [Nocardioides sp.]|nr:catalase [Nocardioides sp.]
LTPPEPSETLVDLDPSPALSQLGDTWPTDGRMVGIVVDPEGDLTGVEELAAAVKAASMVPLVVAPRGGTLPNGMAVQRALGATRSVEFDAVILAGCPAPGADAIPVRDSKAGEPSAVQLDPRVTLLLEETFRHAKAIGAWGAGVEALELAGFGADDLGVVVGDEPGSVFTEVHTLLGSHRVWERFAPTLA